MYRMFQNYKAAATSSETDKDFKMVEVKFIKDEWDQLQCNFNYFIIMLYI